MTKKYLMREIVEKEVELTEEEYQKTLDYKGSKGYKVELLDDVDQYMESFNAIYCREDLEQVLVDAGVPPTEENLKKFMELHPTMKGFLGVLIEDWFERMRCLVNPDDYQYAVMKWNMEGINVEIRIGEDYLDENPDEFSGVYEVWVDGFCKWNYLTLGNAKKICEGIGYGKNVEVLV